MGQKYQPDVWAFKKPDGMALVTRRILADWIPSLDWLIFMAVLITIITPFIANYLPTFKSEAESISFQKDHSSKQWYLDQIQAQQAWSMTTGSRDVVVAVIDTGVDYTHHDLSPNIWVNTAEIPNDGLDNDHNNYIDDYFGWDFIDGDGYPMPSGDNGAEHGTMVAGIIGAVHNDFGINGVAGEVQIMAVRVRVGNGGIDSFLPCSKGQYPYYLAQGIRYAADNGARVVNLSLSSSVASQWLGTCVQDAIGYAVDKGVVIVAASGNRNEDTVLFPALMPLVIAVGATDEQDRRLFINSVEGSNYGERLDVVAPGVDIWTTTTSNQYKPYRGTSLAASQVSGLVALLFSMDPSLSANQVRGYIKIYTQKVEGYNGTNGWNEETGWGRIDVYRTLNAALFKTLP